MTNAQPRGLSSLMRGLVLPKRLLYETKENIQDVPPICSNKYQYKKKSIFLFQNSSCYKLESHTIYALYDSAYRIVVIVCEVGEA